MMASGIFMQRLEPMSSDESFRLVRYPSGGEFGQGWRLWAAIRQD